MVRPYGRHATFGRLTFYAWIKLDDHRSLQKAPIDGSRPDAEWIFLDTQEHTSFLFPKDARLQYAAYKTDDPQTIAFIGSEYPSHTCKKGDFDGDPCPDINLFISQDGGRSFVHRHVIVPDLS